MLQFSPNCSFPSSSPSSFVKDSEIRSTLEIVRSRTSIIILSTWSVLHLTVSPDLCPQGKRQKFRKHVYLLGRKLAWMGIMLAFPEYLVSLSTTNLFTSWVKSPAAESGQGEQLLANIGGIALRFSPPKTSDAVDVPPRADDEPGTERQELASIPKFQSSDVIPLKPLVRARQIGDTIPTIVAPPFLLHFQKSQASYLHDLGNIPWKPFDRHVALANAARPDVANVLTNEKQYKRNHIAPFHGNVWVLDSKQLAIARAHGVIDRLPHQTENEITDRSKTDGLVRLFSLLQVLWLVTQLIVRSAQGVAFSALEISTLAFSSCAVIIYVSEWAKPQDIGVPFYIDTDAIVSPAVFELMAEAAPISFLQPRRYYISQSVVHQVFEDRYKKKHVDWMVIATSILSIMLFGGLHLLA
ncbi:hypothetical protein BDV19DRAFT_389465 [Aspergillus venezuelensis]